MKREREETIRLMRERHSLASRREDGYPVTGPWSFRELCEHRHGWREVACGWLQCQVCWWCKPNDPTDLGALPAILKGCVLPPLQGNVDLRQLYSNAGFVLDDESSSVLSIVRVVVVQYAHTTEPYVRRCGAQVRFKDRGWREAAVFFETGLSKLLGVVATAEPRKPRALWSAIQKTYAHAWRTPWS